MDTDTLTLGLVWYWAFLFSTVAHEAAHAWTAYRLGDPTAYHEGQVSLDPIPHIRREPLGTVAFPLVTYLMGGWMMGWASAPYDPFWAATYPRKAAWMALAGPLANLTIAVAAGIAIRLGMLAGIFVMPESAYFTEVTLGIPGGWWHGAAMFLSILFTLNVVLFTFNLIPLYPLDGSVAITLLMNERLTERYREFTMNPTLSMFGLVIAWQLFDPIFRPLFRVALQCLYPGHF